MPPWLSLHRHVRQFKILFDLPSFNRPDARGEALNEVAIVRHGQHRAFKLPVFRETPRVALETPVTLLVGENGTGKSTLVKTIIGQLPLLAGEVYLGVNVRVGYFAQEQDVLDPDLTPLASLQMIVPWGETEIRNFLHYFLFTGDQPLTPNQRLSYGERARLMLALLVAQGCNFLILDEPINHLDIPSRTQFETALANFEGAALAVVHDRYFIQGFASRVWVVQRNHLVEYFDLEDAQQGGDFAGSE